MKTSLTGSFPHKTALMLLAFALLGARLCPAQSVPVSLWSGEGNANDSVGPNQGQLVNIAFVPGVHGQAFLLDGVSSYIRVPDSPSLRFSNELTIEMWFKRNNASSYGALIDKRSWTECNFGVNMSSDWAFHIYYDDPDYDNWTGQYECSFSAVPAPGVFHHLAGTFRQADASHVALQTYMDGQLVSTDTMQGNLANTFNANAMVIGSAREGDGTFFEGVIDEVALYDRVLTASEVLSNYNAYAPTNSGTVTNQPPVTTNSPPSTTNSLGLVALWHGDDNAQDSVGPNNGTLMNGATFAPGVKGNGFRLDGVNDYIRVPDNASLHLTNELTLEMWFKRETEASYGVLIDKRSWSECNFGVNVSADWSFALYYNDPTVRNPTSLYENSFSDIPSAGVFHHLAGTFRQVTSSNVELQTYIDGQLVQADIMPGNLKNTINANVMSIGTDRDGSSSSSFFQGIIDEVAIYNRVLPASEVLSNYLAIMPEGTNLPPVSTNAGPIVAQWHADGDALDLVGGHDGTLMNGATFAPGVHGQGFMLDGINDYVRVPDQRSLHLSNELTLEMWFKRDNASSYGALMDKRTWANCNYGINMSADWGFQLYYDDPTVAAGNQFEISFSGIPSAGVFHHLAGTFYQVDSGHVQLNTYIDGQLVRTDTLGGNLVTTFNGEALAIGCARDGTGGFFQGVIDEITIYNRALTPAEVVSNYALYASMPQIVTQPQSVTIVQGVSAEFSVSVVGAAPLAFQWSFNGSNLTDETNSVLTIASAQAANAGEYVVVIANASGSVTSSVATLSLASAGVAPSFTVAPAPFYSAFAGSSVSMNAQVAGTPPLLLQWTFNGVAIAGATNQSLTLSSVQPENAGTYRLLVTNDFGFTSSSGSALSINTYGSSEGTLNFANFTFNRVYDVDGNTPVPTNSGFVAALYFGTNTSSLSAVGAPSAFIMPGRFFGGLRTIAGTSAGMSVSLQVCVWDSTVSATYEEAVALGAKHGQSALFQVTLGGGISPPAMMGDLTAFSLQSGTGALARRSSQVSRVSTCLANAGVSAKGVAFVLTGTTGGTYAIEVSSDLVNWTTLSYVLNNSGTIGVTDGQPGARRFYRARLIEP